MRAIIHQLSQGGQRIVLRGSRISVGAAILLLVNFRLDERQQQCSKNSDSAVAPCLLWWARSDVVLCEEAHGEYVAENNVVVGHAPSWWRQRLYSCHILNLPPPPRRLASHDPAFSLTTQQMKRRSLDEAKQQSILQQIAKKMQQYQMEDDHQRPATASDDVVALRKQEMASHQQAWLDVIYGPGATLKDRQDFLERFGCTGWTDQVLLFLLELAGSRGFVEIGAGNGQWARALTDLNRENTAASPLEKKSKHFDLVLAYDDGSRLPLDPRIYHSKTQPAHRYFYSKVQPLRGNSVEATVKQWQCRGRVLVLVYPPAGSDMALEAARAYDEIPITTTSESKVRNSKILVYVGEGRGGANANDAFFDYLEQNGWILERILPVKAFGSKGYEQLFVLRK